jgi:hypothetical protein
VVLEWLLHNSGEPWSAGEKTMLLTLAARSSNLDLLQWLVEEAGAAWPSSFIFSLMVGGYCYGKKCWPLPAVQWALANGYT